jgi:hypothetical protein
MLSESSTMRALKGSSRLYLSLSLSDWDFSQLLMPYPVALVIPAKINWRHEKIEIYRQSNIYMKIYKNWDTEGVIYRSVTIIGMNNTPSKNI